MLAILFFVIGASCAPTLVNVMLPLNTVSLDGKLDKTLLPKLDRIKSEANVSGVMVDVWWGIVEKSQGSYNFGAYKELAQYCQKIGLKLQCVMSFHQCGGNVGDTCDIKLPSWLTQKDIFYRDMHGKDDPEYLSLSMDDQKVNGRTPVDMYSLYMKAFKQQMGDLMGSTINEIQVGLGPCGELRYPAYTNNRGWNFPGVGEFQVYDPGMKQSFKDAAIAAGHSEWDGPPTDAGVYTSYPNSTIFFQTGYQTAYGQFFLNWYSDLLIEHGRKILKEAVKIFRSNADSKVAVAAKVAGIHWWALSKSHAAEATAGYYVGSKSQQGGYPKLNSNENKDRNFIGLSNSQINYSNKQSDSSQSFYEKAAQMMKSLNVTFDFTCFEMKDSQQDQGADCGPEELVTMVLKTTKNAGVEISSENAIEQYHEDAFNQVIANTRKGTHVSAYTQLRLSDQFFQESNFKNFIHLVQELSKN